MRSSQKQCEHVTVLNDIVIMQHHDGFWETCPIANCAITWQGKPSVTLLTDDDRETPLPIAGNEHTLADELATHGITIRRGAHAMSSSDTAIEGY